MDLLFGIDCLTEGEEWSAVLTPLDTNLPVRMMLVWTDAAGHGLGGSTPAWNNDLDLVVEAGGDTFRGNNFGGDGYSIPGGSADLMNNTEGVFLSPAPAGGFTVRVQASNINSDGLPNSGDGTDQDFALACYNCATEPGFSLIPAEKSVEICAPSDAVYTIDVGSVLGFTDPVTLSVSGEPAGTTTSFSVNPVIPAGISELRISNTGSGHPSDEALVAAARRLLGRGAWDNIRLLTGDAAITARAHPDLEAFVDEDISAALTNCRLMMVVGDLTGHAARKRAATVSEGAPPTAWEPARSTGPADAESVADQDLGQGVSSRRHCAASSCVSGSAS